jgi:lysophospholipase L1-like esterase
LSKLYIGCEDKRVQVAEQKELALRSLHHLNIHNILYRLINREKTKIVMTGTSITAGSSTGDSSQKWVELFESGLKSLYPGTEIAVQNNGVGSSTSTHLKENWYTLVEAHNPDLIMIHHGDNDINLSNTEREENYQFFVREANKLGAALLFVTNAAIRFDPSPYGNTFTDDTNRRDEIAQQTRDFGRQFSVGVIDANMAFKRFLQEYSIPQDNTLLNYDHLHPNDLGHLIIANEALNGFRFANDNGWLSDKRFGGKNYTLYGKRTLWDLEQLWKSKYGWATYGLYEQQVSFGGLWWTRDYIGKFQKGKLHGTQVVTGSESSQGNYQATWHIIPKNKDYIELEVVDPKRVWIGISGDSSTATEFEVLINGERTQVIQVGADSKGPIEVSFNPENLKYFTKNKHTIRVQRVGEIPATSYVEFHGFLVQFYNKEEPEIFDVPDKSRKQIIQPNIAYQTLDFTIRNRQQASDVGIIAPLGFEPFDDRFVQLRTDQPSILYFDFYGDVTKVRLKNLIVDNFISIYVDGELLETTNLKDDIVGTVNVRKFVGLGFGREHRVEVVALDGEINLQGVRFGDTLE